MKIINYLLMIRLFQAVFLVLLLTSVASGGHLGHDHGGHGGHALTWSHDNVLTSLTTDGTSVGISKALDTDTVTVMGTDYFDSI